MFCKIKVSQEFLGKSKMLSSNIEIYAITKHREKYKSFSNNHFLSNSTMIEIYRSFFGTI